MPQDDPWGLVICDGLPPWSTTRITEHAATIGALGRQATNLVSAVDAMPRLAPADLRIACHALMSEWLGECRTQR